MKKIPLTKGKFALVDDEDFELVSKLHWYITSHNYAANHSSKRLTYMHRLITNAPQGSVIDHINRNTLDNRKGNLRVADKRINSINRGLQANNTSGHKGVSWMKKLGKWETYIWYKQKKIGLGYFVDIDEAKKVRQIAELKYHAI